MLLPVCQEVSDPEGRSFVPGEEPWRKGVEVRKQDLSMALWEWGLMKDESESRVDWLSYT